MSDLIDRQAAIDMANDMYHGNGIVQATYNDIGKALVKFLNLVPSAHPEQRKGKWIATHEVMPFSNPDSITYVCSECGDKHYTLYCIGFDMKYCPNCGAKMEVKE